ncbi:MAG: Cystathionine beta-synthase [Candidatus Carbobacillus altaicus]|uniref:Cystathionine beta-synthase n=1 Tax=Candidatus Carbonibacillus altaicus TaxID=2163959 RepID=A0A2R6XZP7_9BACL|nr:MAG: Cystathionine beta-synthase [Candidatus Carbobacillus altaicus]
MTPLFEITAFPLPPGVRIFAKLESMNPGGSVKDRLGLALIDAGEQSGRLLPGGTIIEATAGNTGIGLAIAAIGRGYRLICVVPEKFSYEKQMIMRALGVEIVHTPSERGMTGAIERAKELSESISNAYRPDQFTNLVNPEVHYRTTGPEIWDGLAGDVQVFVAGVGSGGTFMGCARFLKEKNRTIRTVVVEPQGSILGGGPAGPHRTEGIGVEFVPPFMDFSYVDHIYTVRDDDAFRLVAELARREGLLVGSSSGAAFYAALQEAETAPKGTNIVVIFPDSSERYLTKNIYEDI